MTSQWLISYIQSIIYCIKLMICLWPWIYGLLFLVFYNILHQDVSYRSETLNGEITSVILLGQQHWQICLYATLGLFYQQHLKPLKSSVHGKLLTSHYLSSALLGLQFHSFGSASVCVCVFTIMLLSELTSWQTGWSQHWLSAPLATPTTITATNSNTGHILCASAVEIHSTRQPQLQSGSSWL